MTCNGTICDQRKETLCGSLTSYSYRISSGPRSLWNMARSWPTLSLCPMAPNHFPQVLSTSVVRYSPGRIQDFYDRMQSEATIYNTVSEFTLDGLRWFLPNQAVMMLYGDPQLMDFCNLARAIMWVIAPLQLVCQRLQSLVDEHSLDLEQALNSEECRALSKVYGHDACLCCTVYSNTVL